MMDHYASLLSEAGVAHLLNTRTLAHSAIQITMDDCSFLVVDSGSRARCSTEVFNERRAECELGLQWLRNSCPNRRPESLGEVAPDDLAPFEHRMPEMIYRRVLHVVEEDQRVSRAVAALCDHDAASLGKLLFASHYSLRDLFEVSTPLLDFLVEWGREHDALGARLIGGGGGGAILHLVRKCGRDGYIRRITNAFEEMTGAEPNVIQVRLSPGAKHFVDLQSGPSLRET